MPQRDMHAGGIEVRREANALLNGGFTPDQAVGLVRLRETWKPWFAGEGRATVPKAPRLEFARWLYLSRRLKS